MTMILRSAMAAFSMYSKIPMPQTEWNEKNTRYLFCFFPLIGLVIGGVCGAVFWAFAKWSAGPLLTGAVMTAIPLLITGGIHLDGFMDTVDARASYAGREKRLEILKDPHIGAFAAIFCGVYLLVSAGAWSEISARGMQMMILVFAFERICSALYSFFLPDARQGGSLSLLKGQAEKRRIRGILLAELVIVAAGMFFLDWQMALPVLVVFILAGLYCARAAVRDFGGVTGDLAGWFLQICELAALLTVVIAAKL